jgi:hypothetical protein
MSWQRRGLMPCHSKKLVTFYKSRESALVALNQLSRRQAPCNSDSDSGPQPKGSLSWAAH